jgi:hypothetical protein
VATTHEEVALQLSRMALESQGDSENQIRAKATLSRFVRYGSGGCVW